MKPLLFIFFLLAGTVGLADSPLTSTPFSKVYAADKMVVHVNENGLDKKALKFLLKKKSDPVIKIAMINAMSWGKKELVKNFENALLQKRKGLKPDVFDYLKTVSEDIPVENKQTNLLTADDLMCWAYFQTMGDYFTPELGSRAAYLAYVREPESMTHAIVFTLIACQIAFDSDWCSVYQTGHKFLEKTSYEKNNLNAEAAKVIMDYLGLYKADCKD